MSSAFSAVSIFTEGGIREGAIFTEGDIREGAIFTEGGSRDVVPPLGFGDVSRFDRKR